MPHTSASAGLPPAVRLDREYLSNWYIENRARSKALFDLVAPDAYYQKPISLRHPIVFYEGHLPAFSFNTLVKRGLGRPSLDVRLEQLFARGIDPHESQAAGVTGEGAGWPPRSVVQQFAAEADRQVLDALENGDIEQPGHPLLDRAEAAYCILEHEAMHQETLLYMWHRLPFDWKRRPQDYQPLVTGALPVDQWIAVPEGAATLGACRDDEVFTWDNERQAHTVHVPAFRMERHDVTNARYMEFVNAGGYQDPQWWGEDWVWVHQERIAHPLFWEREDNRWWWRGMFERIALPDHWPVYVSHAEAAAYARWRGLRLPTEAEYHRAAFGTADGDDRRYPWGAERPGTAHGVFDFGSWDPAPAGSHPAGDSAWGIADLAGNGWEWTSTIFGPFPGFTPLPSYPEYSADFFDGAHMVMKGASPATAAGLIRPSFRNWFRTRYPYVYASFRCVKDGGAA